MLLAASVWDYRRCRAASMNTKSSGLFTLIRSLGLTDPSVSHPAGLRRSFRLGKKSSWVRRAAPSQRWSTGVNGWNPPPAYREVIPYGRDPEDGHRLVVLVGRYELQKQRGWKHLREGAAERTLGGGSVHSPARPLKQNIWSSLELPLV